MYSPTGIRKLGGTSCCSQLSVTSWILGVSGWIFFYLYSIFFGKLDFCTLLTWISLILVENQVWSERSWNFTVNLMDSGTENQWRWSENGVFRTKVERFMASKCFVSFEQCYCMNLWPEWWRNHAIWIILKKRSKNLIPVGEYTLSATVLYRIR